MRQDVDDEEVMRRYLLGSSSPDEQKKLEERLLADDDYFQQMLIVEDELIDDYVGGELPAQEQVRFDNYFLATSEHQRDLRFAKDLRRYVTLSAAEKTPARAGDTLRQGSIIRSLWVSLRPQRPIIGYSLAVTLALIIISGIWLANKLSHPPSQPISSQTQSTPPQQAQQSDSNTQQPNETQSKTDEQANLNSSPSISEKQGKPNPGSAAKTDNPKASTFQVALASGVARDTGEMKRVRIPHGAKTIQLRLELDPQADDYQIYRAVLQTGAGQEILSKTGLHARAEGHIVVWELPANLFRREDYYLILSGRNSDNQFESVGTYSFRIVEK